MSIKNTDIFGFKDDKKYDLIILSHSFEHMDEPLRTLKEIKKHLKDSGYILMAIPVIGKLWDIYKENWMDLDCPRHLFLHSKESMEMIADMAGLDIKKIFYNDTANGILASEAYKRNIAGCDFEEKGTMIFNNKMMKKQAAKDIQKYNQENASGRAMFIIGYK